MKWNNIKQINPENSPSLYAITLLGYSIYHYVNTHEFLRAYLLEKMYSEPYMIGAEHEVIALITQKPPVREYWWLSFIREQKLQCGSEGNFNRCLDRLTNAQIAQ